MTDTVTTPRWLPVVGFEGLYEVSDQGAVRSIDRTVPHGHGGDTTRNLRGRELKQITHEKGHLYVFLSESGNLHFRFVHRLVLDAFVEPWPEGLQGCHGDGNPANNSLANLRWGTQGDNMNDAVLHGTHPQASKTHCPRGHEYTEQNTYRFGTTGGRRCRECREIDRDRKNERRRKARRQKKELVSE